MLLKSRIADFFLRVAICLVIGGLFGWLLSGLSYLFTPDKQAAQRDPRTIELVVPYGTAEQIRQGGSNPGLPPSMTFVEGDVLVVRNDDVVAHRLGPLFIPPGTASALQLGTANDYSYTCSFQPGQNLGVTVLPRITGGVQLQAVLAIGLPTGMMLAVYSYMIDFGKKKEEETQTVV